MLSLHFHIYSHIEIHLVWFFSITNVFVGELVLSYTLD